MSNSVKNGCALILIVIHAIGVLAGVAAAEPETTSVISSSEELPEGEWIVDGEALVESDLESSDAVEVIVTETPCDGEACEPAPLTHDWFAPQRIYRRRSSGTFWMPAGQDEMGWFGLRSEPYLDACDSFGVIGGINIDWLDGPIQPDLPPRVYSFQMGLQLRDQLSPEFSYDLASSIGVYSDFEDSARDGIRYPSHAVGFLHVDRQLDLVFGVDYLDRDDIKILPVMGIVLRDPNAKVRAELVFPRPKIALEVDCETSVFLKAELGGGSWDIEFPDESNDVFTYRDYSISVGWETLKEPGKSSSIEFGIVFDRRLEFRNSATEYGLENSFMVRCVEFY